MSDSRHNDPPAALKPLTEQQSRIMDMLLDKATFEVGRRQGSRLTGISKQGDNASHLMPPNTSNLASLATPSFGVAIPPIKNNISTTAYTKIPSIEASNLDEEKPMCRTESSETSWSTGDISIDSGCFCSAGSKVESCTHAPSEDTIRGPPIPLRPEDFDFPEPIPRGSAFPKIFENCANLGLSRFFSYVTALEPGSTSQPALPASTDPSDCGYSRETSEDSVETYWSSDQASSSSAVAERRKHQLVVHLMARLQEWLEVALKRHGVQSGQSASSGDPTPAVTASGRSGDSSNNQNKRKHQGNDSGDELGENDETPDRIQKRRKKGSVDVETRYVCPFFKHNRERYKTSHWKSCCWPGWTSVHRVKEHLYRRHMLPKFRCNRCRQDLKSAFNLNEHLRADTICDRQSEGPEEEGINEEQERLLRVRKRKNGKARQVTEEEKWAEMYRILFPDDDPVPSPYPELCPLQPEQEGELPGTNVLDNFEDYARREFSRRMLPRVQNLVDENIEQTLASQRITDIATNVLQDIMESFRKGKRKRSPEFSISNRRRRSPSRSPRPEEMPAVSSLQVPREIHNFATGPYPNLEIDIDEILNSLDANQSLELERWGIEDEGMNTFNHFGLQVEQYSKANA